MVFKNNRLTYGFVVLSKAFSCTSCDGTSRDVIMSFEYSDYEGNN